MTAAQEPNKKTPLHYAAHGGHKDVVEFLLDKGAQVSRPNIVDETPLHYGAGPREKLPNGETLLQVTPLIGPAEALGIFVGRDVPVNTASDVAVAPLMVACAGGNVATAKALLEQGLGRLTWNASQNAFRQRCTRRPSQAAKGFPPRCNQTVDLWWRRH